jgi:Domain of unknown function (DUF2382)
MPSPQFVGSSLINALCKANSGERFTMPRDISPELTNRKDNAITHPQEETGSSMAPTESESLTIQLLAERLVATQRKQKIGEVVIRKEVSTHIVEVPVRQEKLIIEQVSPHYKKIADITPEKGDHNPVVTHDTEDLSVGAFQGHFLNAKTASEFLSTIAEMTQDDQAAVEVSIQLTDAKLKDTYDYWLRHYS